VTTILGFRTLVAAFCLLAYVAIFERRLSTRTLGTVTFWLWTGVFLCTVFLYGFAFVGRPLADVYLVTALMPIFVILIERIYYGRRLRRRLIPPIAVMFFAATLPHFYKMISGHSALVLSWGTWFALLGAACHAIWIVIGRAVELDSPEASQATRASYMFLMGSMGLLFFANTDAALLIEQSIRGPIFHRSYLYFSYSSDHLNLLFAGLLSALSVLSLIKAISIDGPINIAPYQYTLAIWGAILTFLFASGGPENTSDVLSIMAVGALIVLLGAVWLHKRRVG
jgi:drug/metabolite transporter (DMT)-like permease